MFTGIVESLAVVESIQKEESNISLWLSCNFVDELQIDQSVAHNGVCLTVVEIEGGQYKVTAIQETLRKTNIGALGVGDCVNLERCMKADGRFDGHIVQGHVDTTAVLKKVESLDGSWNFEFQLSQANRAQIVEKGSVCINGVSLTVVKAGMKTFTVSIIPYTYEHTTFHQLRLAHEVNIEFDILGKYVLAAMDLRQ